MLKKVTKFIFRHKLLILIVLIVVAGGVYWRYKKTSSTTEETRYVLGQVSKGTVITTVSGSGQISASNQIDIKAKVSGNILDLKVKNGQEVKAGDVIALIDAEDAHKAIRDAQTNLQSAELAFEKFKQPADEYTLMQAENALTSAKNNLAKLLEPPDSYSILQAENSLKSAQDSLEKLKLSQATNYQNALDAKVKTEETVTKTYEDVFNAIADTFLDLPNIVTDTNTMLYSEDICSTEISAGANQINTSALMNVIDTSHRESLHVFQISAEKDYKTARLKYDSTFTHYKNLTRYSEHKEIEDLLDETLETTKAVAQALKSESNYFDAWVDFRTQKEQTIFAKVEEYQASLASYIGQTNSHLSTLLSLQNSLNDNFDALENAKRDIEEMDKNNPLDLAAAEATIKEKEASLEKLKADPDPIDIAAAEASIKEKEASLKKLQAGPDPLDLKSQELALKQKQTALSDAKAKLVDYTIYASFDGLIAALNIKKGDAVSSGTSIITLISKQKTAQISLNEVDSEKVKEGQKATLTFDAISDLSLTGTVAEIDTLGTVSQGVVTYNVKIIFDTQDDRIKPGMSVTSAIITNIAQEVLNVPNSAIKTEGNNYYVEILENMANQANESMTKGVTSPVPPTRKNIEIGLANDSITEIKSGLKENDMIIIRIISSSSTQTQQGQSILQMGRGAGGGGNIMRMAH